MAGVCDDRQTFCFALALWNGRDPILKERMFGLGGDGGNHGEDVKEYWWYEDSTPTHSWMRWRYHYPQAAFPYDELVAVNALRGRDDTEYELVDTGIFDDDRYWAVTVDYAKASPTDLCMLVTVANRGDRAATLHVLPTLWFRNTWAWGLPGGDRIPRLTGQGTRLVGEHRVLGQMLLEGDGGPVPLLCDNDTNAERLWGLPGRSPYPKDGINDHVVDGAATVNPAREGTKGALHYVLDVPAGGQRADPAAADPHRVAAGRRAAAPGRPRRRLRGGGRGPRRAEANRFFAGVIPPAATADEALVARQAIAGLMWGKQFYHFDVKRWLEGDPGSTPPPAGRRHGRNSAWWHMTSFDVISMPDPWEYPWYAAWDLAFHCVSIARVDPGFAKEQLLLLLREWYLHPNGQIPAYEWAFGDVNPPVHALGGAEGLRDRRRPRLRLPGPGDAQAAAQLHLVGQPQGHRRQQRLRGRLPRAGQRRPVRPLGGAAGGRGAGAVRRHRLDGHVRAQPAGHGHRAGRARPGLRGHRDEVLRALRVHRRRRVRAGAVGRRGRLLLRRAAAGRRQPRCR